MKASLQIGVSLVVSGVAVWWSLHDVEFGRFLADLAKARLVWLLPMMFFAALAMVLRAMRWRVILTTLGPLENTPVFDATNIGFMGNMILPLRAGEVLKPLVVARGGEISAPAAFASVALERVSDLLMLGFMAVAAVFLVPQGDFLRARMPTVIAGTVGLLVFLILVVVFAERLVSWIDWIASRLPGSLGRILGEVGRGGLKALSGLSQKATMFRVTCLSLAVWIAAAGGFISGALALGISAPMIPLGIVTAVIVAIAVSVPSAPGFIGVFWAGSEIALSLFGVDKSMGFTFGVLNWLVQMVVICSMGAWSLWRLDLSLSDLRRSARSSAQDAEAV